MEKIKWIYKPFSSGDVKYLVDKYNIPQIIAVLMAQRNLLDDSIIKSFFNPDKNNLFSPYLLNDMEKAVSRIKKALLEGEKITVYGDYDVDGVTATAVLYMYLKSEGANVNVYIPDREDGYGLSISAVTKIAQEGSTLIVTVDCGITSNAEITFAKSLGTDIVVTDHHTYKEPLLDAVALVSASVPQNKYPCNYLAGVGTAFKLVCALAGEDKFDEMLRLYSPYVALGTVGDIVPLKGENRILVHTGIEVIKKCGSIGINALIEAADASSREVNSELLAYTLCPRINAAGRMGSAYKAFELLITQDITKANEKAADLCLLNEKRRETENQVSRKAEEYIEKNIDFSSKKVLVAAGEDWHHGVLGIVASRITQKYKKPSIILNKSDFLTGSCRSVEGFNLYEAIKSCENLLEKFGGHSMAAGITLRDENLKEFDEKINAFAQDNLPDNLLSESITIDCEINPNNIKPGLIKMLSRFMPFGCENEGPIFSICGAYIVSIAKMGAGGKHLRVIVKKNGIILNCVGFSMGECADNLFEGQKIKIAFSPSLNTYMGRTTVQLILEDIQEDI